MGRQTSERRTERRARTRLRPGKLVDGAGRHLADCAILDRSPAGARVRLLDRAELKEGFRVIDEGERISFRAELVWRSTATAGLRLEPDGTRMEADAFALATGPYYAVR